MTAICIEGVSDHVRVVLSMIIEPRQGTAVAKVEYLTRIQHIPELSHDLCSLSIASVTQRCVNECETDLSRAAAGVDKYNKWTGVATERHKADLLVGILDRHRRTAHCVSG